MKDLTTLKGYKTLTDYQIYNLKKVYQAILDGQIYADIKSVSRSGMSRRICFYMVEDGTSDNPYFSRPHIIRVTNEIAWLTEWVKAGEYKQGGKYLIEDGLKVDGCGMDMIFHTLYTAIGWPESGNWSQEYRRL
jgi:hypothetical protein